MSQLSPRVGVFRVGGAGGTEMADNYEVVSKFVRELARNDELVTALLLAHPAEGVCFGCKVPGSLHPVAAPCSVRELALYAYSLRVGPPGFRAS